jgi:hypothetical protein
MYWLDIVAIVVIAVFGLLGLTGSLKMLSGLVFGIILAILILAITPSVLEKYNKYFNINIEKSIIIRNIDHFVTDSIMGTNQTSSMFMYDRKHKM